MRCLLQRVTKASVRVEDKVVGKIGRGLVIFAAVGQRESEEDLQYLIDKITNLRIFPDESGRFNVSLLDIQGELLVISQFTLFADTRKGRRPSFTEAAPPKEAEAFLNRFVDLLRVSGLRVETGRFGEHMEVEIYNDGPVTIWIDSKERERPRRSV